MELPPNSSDTKKLIEPLRDKYPASLKKLFVAVNAKERGIGWNALRLESSPPRLLDHRREVLARRLVANLAVGLTGDEAEICDVVRLAACVVTFEDGLWEDMVELELVLHPGMVERDRTTPPPGA
jgi:hypothetical protein